jgi:hypothetical protein
MATRQGNNGPGKGNERQASSGEHGAPPFEMLPTIVMEKQRKRAERMQLRRAQSIVSHVENNG